MARPVPPLRLLAKSSKQPETPRAEETLVGHTAAVMASAEVLLERTGRDQLSILGLEPETWMTAFKRIVLLACWLHDLGKANDQFQDLVRGGRRGKRQAIRHEALSYYIARTLLNEPLRLRFAPEDLTLALWAGAGHHRKFPPEAPSPGSGHRLLLWTDHTDFRKVLKLGEAKLGLVIPPVSRCELRPARLVQVEFRRRAIEEQRVWRGLSLERRRLLAATKACVIAADVGGSALPRQKGVKLKPWIRAAFDRTPTKNEIEQVVRARLGDHELRDFQKKLGRSTARVTLALAGCGSGKTVAAYHWAASCAPNRRLYFCYPTTGTTTEGFRDYLHGLDVEARLVHGRSAVDVEIFDLFDENVSQQAPVFALEAWSTPVTCCTVDAVLGLIQNQRRALFSWPSLAASAFIFDEVHAYDKRLFGALLRFLEICCGAHCLLMTASLPRARLEAIRTVVEELQIVRGPRELEEHPRYRKEQTKLDELLAEALKNGNRILWVSNSVRTVLEIAEGWALEGPTPLIYHSRFRYMDRVARHGAVIDRFKAPRGIPSIALTTQVCEMSLDISADLLITDLAPVPSLIQRLGRLNRRARPGDGKKPLPFVVLEPEHALPYRKDDLQRARLWLDQLGGVHLSQADLASAWETLGDTMPIEEVESAWTNGGFKTSPLHLRDATYGVTVILAEDAALVRKRKVDPVKVRLPMPQPPRAAWPDYEDWYDKRIHAYVPPAEALNYDALKGGRWNH